MKISHDSLRWIQIQEQSNLTSLNQTISEDDESELADMIPSKEKSLEHSLNLLADKEWRIVLKKLLTPAQYFIIYHRYFRS